MRKFFIMGVALMSLSMSAQQFKVTKVEQIEADGMATMFHPVFTPDGKSLMVSAEDFRGLGLVDIATKKYKHLSSDVNAGWKATMSPDCKTVVTRSADFATQRMSLYKVNVATAEKTLIAADIEHINDVSVKSKALTYAIGGKLRAMSYSKAMPAVLSDASAESIFATCEDLKMVVYKNGVRTVVDPILATTGQDLNYCSISLSPNK